MTKHDDLQVELAELDQQIAGDRALRARLVENRLLPEDRARLGEILESAIAALEQAEREGPEAVEALYAELESVGQNQAPRPMAPENCR